MARLSISLSESDKTEVSEIRIDGIVDTNTAGELEETFDSLLSRQRYRIIVDLAGVEYISSAGWGAIISRIRDIRSKSGDILLSGMVANVHEVFELLEFDNVLKHFKTLDDARNVFGIPSTENSAKKKESDIIRLEILETANSSNGGHLKSLPLRTGLNPAQNSIESLLISSIENDPFMSISEIVQHINNLSDTTRVGWWKVFKMLRRNKLLSPRSRFRLARHHLNNKS